MLPVFPPLLDVSGRFYAEIIPFLMQSVNIIIIILTDCISSLVQKNCSFSCGLGGYWQEL
jgi:hypothetical protein